MAALAERIPQSLASYASVMEFMGRLQRIPLVQRIGLTAGVDVLEMWILFRTEEQDAVREAIEAEDDFLLSTGPIPMDFHFHPLDAISLGTLPEMTVVFERG